MTSNERKDLQNKVKKSKGGRDSAHDANVQFIGGEKVTHIDTNRTKIGKKTYFGSSAANQALDNL